MTPPAFLIIFTSPFLMPKAAGNNSVSRVSMHERIAIFLSGYLLVIYFSYPLFATNCLLNSRISSNMALRFYVSRKHTKKTNEAVHSRLRILMNTRLFTVQ